MLSNVIINSFEERKPIVKDELRKVLKINNNNTLNQVISHLVSFGVLNRFENGVYYIPSSGNKFSDLKPSLADVIDKKYLENYQGIRTGDYLLYKYKLTTQISSYYEILSNKVSESTRAKKLYEGKVVVSYPPFIVNEDNVKLLEILEVIKHIHSSDYGINRSKERLNKLINQLDVNKKEIIDYSNYYKGKRYAGFRRTVREIVNDETSS